MPPRHLLPLLALVGSVPAMAANGVHLWYDENGQAVYSQFAPSGDKETRQVKPPPPPAESPEVARQRLQERLQRFEDQREDEELARERLQKAQSDAALDQQRCQDAQHNLQLLNGRARQLFKTPDGRVRRLTEEERQAKRAEMEQIIAETCR